MGKTTRTLRYARAWLDGGPPVRERVLWIEREDRAVPARVVLPAQAAEPLPAWILLHGVTRPGIEHPQLLRFARALAASGALVLVPEVPEWKDLRLAPDVTLPTLIAAVGAVRGMREASRSSCGVMGFSFGGPQALIAASHDAVASHVGGLVSFGGYCDLERTLRFHFTGEHEWNGRLERIPHPDPYGRWIVGANYLAVAPGFGAATDVTGALWALAAAAGERGAPAGSPQYDALKERLRSKLRSGARALFDVFAPPSGKEPDPRAAEEVIAALVSGSGSIDPLMEPTPFLGRLRHPVALVHGRGDRLIPYTESLRLRERLPRRATARVTVTKLFAHTKEDRVRPLERVREAGRFARALLDILGMI